MEIPVEIKQKIKVTVDEFDRDREALKQEFMEMPRAVGRMGLTILFPLIPLVALVVFVAWTVIHSIYK